MHCSKCGNILNSTDEFCRICGEKVVTERPVNTHINGNGVIGNEISQANPNASIFGTATIENNMSSATPDPVINNEAKPQVTTPDMNNTQKSKIPVTPSPMIANILKSTPQVEPTPVPEVKPNPAITPVPPIVDNAVQPDPMVNEPLNQPENPQPINNSIDTPISDFENKTINPEPIINNRPLNNIANQKRMLVAGGAILGLIIVGIIVLVVFIFSDKNGVNPSNNNGGAAQQNMTSTIDYNNYQFSVPEGYIATLNVNALQVVNNNDKIAFVINIPVQNISLTSVIAQKESLRSSLAQQGINVTDIIQKTYINKDLLIIKAIQNGQIVDYAMAEIESGKTIQIEVINGGISSDDRVYQDLVNTLISAKKKSSSLATDDNQNNGNFTVEKFDFKFEE